MDDARRVALVQTTAVPGWIGVVGIAIGPALMLCSLEFVGRDAGWRVAERLTPPAYVAWSLWLIATGVALLVGQGAGERQLRLGREAGEPAAPADSGGFRGSRPA